MCDTLLSEFFFFTFCLAAHFVLCSVRFSMKLLRTQTKFQSIGQPKQWNQSLVPPNKWSDISVCFMKMHPRFRFGNCSYPSSPSDFCPTEYRERKVDPRQIRAPHCIGSIIFSFPGNMNGRSPMSVTCRYFRWRLLWYDKHLWSECISLSCIVQIPHKGGEMRDATKKVEVSLPDAQLP